MKTNSPEEYNAKARAVVTAIIIVVIASFFSELALAVESWDILFFYCVMFGGMNSCAILLILVTWDKYKVVE